MIVWVGPGVLQDGKGGEIHPGERLNEHRHDPRQIEKWIREGKVQVR